MHFFETIDYFLPDIKVTWWQKINGCIELTLIGRRDIVLEALEKFKVREFEDQGSVALFGGRHLIQVTIES